MTDDEIYRYYASLLILQYAGKPKAVATIKALVTPVIMNQLATQVQNAYTIGDTVINGVTYPGAVGVQLDVLGKYAGVTRSGVDINGNPITLNDIDYTTLIKLAIVTNSSGSSLADIQELIWRYFPNEIFVFDGANMQMSYLIASSIGNQPLVELFITKGLLPKPMGVQLSTVVYIPTISLFGFLSYDMTPVAWDIGVNYSLGAEVFENGILYSSLKNNNLGNDVTDATFWVALIYPFNSYDAAYQSYTWLSYDDGINIL